MAKGFIQPREETQALWDALEQARQAREFDKVGKLSDQIRRLTILLAKEDRDKDSPNQTPQGQHGGLHAGTCPHCGQHQDGHVAGVQAHNQNVGGESEI